MKSNISDFQILQQLKRSLALLLVASLIAATGCSQVCEIPVHDIDPEGTGKTQVVTNNGYIYEFDDVFVRADSLVGTYQLTEERLYKDGSIAYVDVDHETVLPLTLVSHLQMNKTDVGNTILLGAGATILGFWISGLDDVLMGNSKSGTYVKDTGGSGLN